MALITVDSQQLSAVSKQSYSINHDAPHVNLYKNNPSEFHAVRYTCLKFREKSIKLVFSIGRYPEFSYQN